MHHPHPCSLPRPRRRSGELPRATVVDLPWLRPTGDQRRGLQERPPSSWSPCGAGSGGSADSTVSPYAVSPSLLATPIGSSRSSRSGSAPGLCRRGTTRGNASVCLAHRWPAPRQTCVSEGGAHAPGADDGTFEVRRALGTAARGASGSPTASSKPRLRFFMASPRSSPARHGRGGSRRPLSSRHDPRLAPSRIPRTASSCCALVCLGVVKWPGSTVDPFVPAGKSAFVAPGRRIRSRLLRRTAEAEASQPDGPGTPPSRQSTSWPPGGVGPRARAGPTRGEVGWRSCSRTASRWRSRSPEGR